MEMKHKCNYCNALLSETNSVFVHINRYDANGRSSRQLWMCCKCWDNTKIQTPDYYHLDDMPDNKFKEDYKKCGNCRHLIFKDFKHQEGLCDLTRLHRCFYNLCVHDEDIM